MALVNADLSQTNKELAAPDVKIARMEKAHAHEVRRLEDRAQELVTVNDSLGDKYSATVLELDRLKRHDPVTVTTKPKWAPRHKAAAG
ncbi:hypothetical protein Thiowin_01110 [Thiorhodovibrio winogradskyi]|uniref:Uncharacterized protein n=1 Tax=Thiorhodovibrio winogradskyi TaxID=77007 RepID=A0ABZ0S6K3_9GAMM|nr:hypothetical protein [Thiorhodovibrio winogradskyi]